MLTENPTAAEAAAAAEAAQTLALALAELLIGSGLVSLAHLLGALDHPDALADVAPGRRPLAAAELLLLRRLIAAAGSPSRPPSAPMRPSRRRRGR